ncbi:MAG: TonB-dependent receptor [Candidatus Cloacimonadaceae bacterium]
MRKNALILLIVLLVGVVFLDAQTTGRVVTRVRDAQGRPLEFVNVVVMSGNQRITGGQTNARGQLIIINVPPGVYSVRFSLVGYDTVTYENIRVQVGQAAQVDPQMARRGIETAAVVVQGEADAVGKDRIGSAHQIDMDSYLDSSVTNVTDIVAMQAGVTNIGGELHIRGGRSNEVNFTVDGMSVSDPVDGGSALSVDTDAIKDMKVMTGGFPAEFGNAQSGVINIVTKDGDPFYSGKIEYNTDHIIGTGRNSDVVKLAIGGPVIPFSSQDLKERFTFYLNGGGEWMDGRYKDLFITNPNEDYSFEGRSLLDHVYPIYDPYKDRSSILGIDLGNRNYNNYNVNLKTKYDINHAQKLTFAVRGDRSFNTPFSPGGSYAWRYALDHYQYNEVIQRQYIGTYDHMFNPTMHLTLKASYYNKTTELAPRGIDRDNFMFMIIDPDNPGENYVDDVAVGNYGYITIDDDYDGVHDYGNFRPAVDWAYRLQSMVDTRPIPGFYAPGTIYTNFIDDETTTLNFRGDFEWQINETHLAKTGLELIRHDIEKNQLQNFLSVYEDRRQEFLKGIYNVTDADTARFHTDGTVDVPDELYALVSVTGSDAVLPSTANHMVPVYKPLDYYNAAKAASGQRDGYAATPWQAAYYVQDKMEWEGMIVNAGLRFDFWYLGDHYKVLQDDGTFRNRDFKSKDRMQMMISPRLGVSHPITERDVLRFAYNYQNQLPQMQYIFTSKTPQDATLSDIQVTVGNPTLEPQITVTYEVGLSHQLSDDYVIDMTAYYKNLYNYVSTMKERKVGEESVSWYRFISEDYGSTRGIDVQLEKMLSNFNTWTLAYSLAWANGNNSSTRIQDENTSLREFPLDWDIRHNASVNYTFRIGRGEEFFIPFTNLILPLDDFSASMSWNLASGRPYTPQNVISDAMMDTNSKRMKPTHQANLRLAKGVYLGGRNSLRFFFDVENIFKTKNVMGVYPKTGSPYQDGADLTDSMVDFVYPEVEFTHLRQIRNPSLIDNYRGMTFGVSYNF